MLKTFWLNKPTEEKHMLPFRGLEEPENIVEISIEEELPFKYLTINNLKDSRFILSIHNLKFKTKDDNTVTLFMGENLILEKNLKEADKFKIGHKVVLKDTSSSIELYSVKAYSNTSVNLLDDHYVILTPGGSLIIELKQEVYKIELTLASTLEEL